MMGGRGAARRSGKAISMEGERRGRRAVERVQPPLKGISPSLVYSVLGGGCCLRTVLLENPLRGPPLPSRPPLLECVRGHCPQKAQRAKKRRERAVALQPTLAY